jgi:hypothetical protein
MPGDFRCDLTTRVLSATTSAHAAIGRIGRPAFPAPSFRRGRNARAKTRAKRVARMRRCVSVIARSVSDEAIHSFFVLHDGLLRGACHRARIRATRWLAMTSKTRLRLGCLKIESENPSRSSRASEARPGTQPPMPMLHDAGAAAQSTKRVVALRRREGGAAATPVPPFCGRPGAPRSCSPADARPVPGRRCRWRVWKPAPAWA